MRSGLSGIRFAAFGMISLLTMTSTPASTTDDPFAWLEDVEGDRALTWVRAQNERSLAQLTKDPRYERFYEAALAIAEDKSRIPFGSLRNGWIYNFWQDETHVRGLWRRATLKSYKSPNPEWQSLLDVDALAKSEGQNWVYKGAICLMPEGRRCLVRLSNGGKDASVVREFDIEKREFIADGFVLPEAKSDVTWLDENTLLVSTDWGEGTLTTSGYPFIVKLWSRGQPLSAAQEIYRGKPDYVAAGSLRLEGPGEKLLLVYAAETFFTATHWVLGEDGKLAKVTLPPKSTPKALYRGEFVFTIEEDWTVSGRTCKSGALLSMPVADLSKEAPRIRVLMQPGPRDSIDDVRGTSSGVLVASYSNVRGRALRFTFDGKKWAHTQVPLPDNGAVALETTSPYEDTAFISYQDFLQPTTLYALDVGANRVAPAKNLPEKFDGSRYVVEQLEATSRDGTKVPYFVVRPKAFQANGSAPTLLYGYGGFQVSMLPSYSATVGRLWLEQGGVYVLANIRGGGEFGPAWHDAGLKTKRQVVYDDFIAVAEDLIKRKITSRNRLGIMGGSNGGLLMGVMLTQRPELFGAAVVQVPLLDMLRYHQLLAGASWIDEYGSPDVPEERAWLEQLSPYHRLTKRDDFPAPFLVTSTKDDRVHPAHARKFAAKMESLGMPFLYYENIDGGHSAAANQRERAKRQALEFTYLSQRLIGGPTVAANADPSTAQQPGGNAK
jgi:prolyl oligopeptidase